MCRKVIFKTYPGPAILHREERGIVVDFRIPYRWGHGQAVEGKPPATLAAAPFVKDQGCMKTMCES